MAHDMSGMQRSGDADYPDFYTLNSGGMINSFLENMEQINVNTGAKENEAGAETSSGKVLMPNSGSGNPAWGNMDVMVMRKEMPWSPPDSLMGPGWRRKSPGSSASSRYMMGLDKEMPWSPPDSLMGPGWRRKSPGSSASSRYMMSAGYNDPNYGLPSDGGGSFIGSGGAPTCIMPMPMQPSVPVGGLFGPDAFMSFWGNPGYDPPPDIFNPGIELPPGIHGHPEDPDPWMTPHFPGKSRWSRYQDSPEVKGLSLPFPIGEVTVQSESDMIEQCYPGVMRMYMYLDLRSDPNQEPRKGSKAWLNKYYVYVGNGNYELKSQAQGKQGSQVHYGDKSGKHVARSSSGEKISVDVSHKRTGLTSHEETTNVVYGRSAKEGVEYYRRQAKGYQTEAGFWMGVFVAGTLLTIGLGVTGGIGTALRFAFGEEWYDSCLGIRKLGKGWSYGRRCKTPTGKSWPWRIEFERGKGLHYHRRIIDPKTGETIEGGGIGKHRPWDPPAPGTPWWRRF